MASKSTVTSIAASTSSASLASANPDRTAILLCNSSTSEKLYYALATTASASAFTAVLPAGETHTLSEMSGRAWKGAVSAIWPSTTGAACMVTELE